MQKISVRDIILEELASKPQNWSQLLHAVEKARSISQSTFYYHLKRLLQAEKIRKVHRPDGLILYELVETKEEPTKFAKRTEELENVDKEEIIFLLNMIAKASTHEAKKQAFTELKNIVKNKNVTLFPKIWAFFKDTLNNESYRTYWGELLGCLHLILENAKASNDEKTINIVKNSLLPTILEIARTPTSARRESVALIDEMLVNDKKFEQLKEIAEKIMEQGDDVAILYPLATMYKTRKMDIWRWLYPLIDGDNKDIQQNASELLYYMRAVAKTS
jgi:DNA-binding transcriptional ArsR family regulator